jgi:hypothetical protein
MVCPHCGGKVAVSSHSAFVTGRGGVGEEFSEGEYHPDPEKRYKTPEKLRRSRLAYYWRNRERVLAREKAKRVARKGR